MPGRISFPASKTTCVRPTRSSIALNRTLIGPTATKICSCSGARFAGRPVAWISTGRFSPRRRRLAQLKAQRDSAMRGSSPRGRRDDIVAELARNHCGEQYAHEHETQRSHNSSIFSFFSNEEKTRRTSRRRKLCAAARSGIWRGRVHLPDDCAFANAMVSIFRSATTQRKLSSGKTRRSATLCARLRPISSITGPIRTWTRWLP